MLKSQSQVSERGVVFFRAQDGLNIELQKILAQRLGEQSGKPKTSSLHIHPVNNAYSKKDPTRDDHITLIGDAQAKAYANHFMFESGKKQTNKNEWHSDITFEKVPCDYAVLRMSTLPETGGGQELPSFKISHRFLFFFSAPLQRRADM